MPRLKPFGLFTIVLGIASAFAGSAFAGPPFLTDDPEPVPFEHWEFYLFSTVDSTHGNTNALVPAFEFNIGALPNLQLHLVIPFAGAFPADAPSTYGVGDWELGLKYRFVQETDACPQVGIFPMLEIPTGDPDRGLGNGQAWWKLPIWLQESWGPWTTYGGGGYAVNPAPGQHNYCFGGWLLQRNFGERLTLGGEVFAQGTSSDATRSFAVGNVGGFFKITPTLQLLFTVGHTFVGDVHTIGYLGLYWAGGFGKGEGNHSEPKPLSSFLRAE